jgi:hypothetical protein
MVPVIAMCMPYLQTSLGRQQCCHKESQTAKPVAVFVRLTQHIKSFLRRSGFLYIPLMFVQLIEFYTWKAPSQQPFNRTLYEIQNGGLLYLGRGLYATT